MQTAPRTHLNVHKPHEHSRHPTAAGIAAAGLITVMSLRSHMLPWEVMWLMAVCLFAFFKWLTWSHRSARIRDIGAEYRLGYLFGWVGLDVDEFCALARFDRKVAAREWILAAMMTMCGAMALWVLIPHLPAAQPVSTGGLGFAGMLLFLHFGLFHLLALAWRRNGIAVEPIMHLPLLATSLADFWGRRWNRAYRQVSFDYFFRPAVSRFGVVVGTLIAFFASGLIHELVISFPAGAGYGGPTVYFVIQGLGLLFERSAAWRRLTRRYPFCGWLCTLVFLIGPVGLLFHEAFLTRVIAPFLEVIGAR